VNHKPFRVCNTLHFIYQHWNIIGTLRIDTIHINQRSLDRSSHIVWLTFMRCVHFLMTMITVTITELLYTRTCRRICMSVTDVVIIADHTGIVCNEWMLSNDCIQNRWKEGSWPDLKQHPGIRMERLRKTTRNLSQYRRCPGRNSNQTPSEYRSNWDLIYSQQQVWRAH
jgi:hypothetical protein